MGVKVRGWFSPLWIALAGTVLFALLLVLPISFLAPGDHEMTDCGNLLVFDARGYNREYPGDRDYWEVFVRNCTSGSIDRLVQLTGVLAVTGLLVTISLTTPSRRRATGPARRSATLVLIGRSPTGHLHEDRRL